MIDLDNSGQLFACIFVANYAAMEKTAKAMNEPRTPIDVITPGKHIT